MHDDATATDEGPTEHGLVVVGCNGSEESLRALAWATDEAARRQAVLRVVTAWKWPPMYGIVPAGFDPKNDALEVQEAALAKAVGDNPGVELERVVLEGTAAGCLLHEAEHADLLVVGNRGRGGFRGLLLGSVSEQCAHHAPCPVVIVR